MTPEELEAALEAELQQLEEDTAEQVREAVLQVIAAGITAAALAGVIDAVVRMVRAAVRLALRLGGETAGNAARGAGRTPRRRRGRVPTVRRPSRAPMAVPVEREVRRVMGRAIEDLGRASGDEARQEVADRAIKQLESVATTAVNQAASAGVNDAARRLGADGVMWVAERDGCLTCQALSGHTMPLGKRFPAASTFGDHPLKWWGFDGLPPRHPHCRCRAKPVWGDSRAASSALQREARRSVVRGFSLPSESGAARLRAADRLLRRGAGLPRTVEEYGRNAVTAGRFPRGRAVP